jgi:hypothetical protein
MRRVARLEWPNDAIRLRQGPVALCFFSREDFRNPVHVAHSGHLKNRTALRSLVAILGLGSCLYLQSLTAAPAPAATVGTATAPLAVDPGTLFQHWVRSTEEEQAGGTVQIFRPAGSREFPPRRFRMAYKFARDGSCEYYFLSPDDAHRFKPCRWTIGGSDGKTLQVSADGTTTTFRIIELSAKLLRLEPSDSQ